jgi:CubicO group peptidase (beta-lactamase class C family)
MRYSFFCAIVLLAWSAAVVNAGAGSAIAADPASFWKFVQPDAAPSHAAAIDDAVRDFARQHRPTAVMVVQDDRILATSGDITRKVSINSVRKSLLGALVGIAVERGQLDIDDTLDRLGIDDSPPSLTTKEKQATVRHLLMSRSGVYHLANYESRDMRVSRPPRGSHAPGTFWYYNNWDFNALGTIHEKATGESVFRSFEALIARPTEMQDFAVQDGTLLGDGSSIHRAYAFKMTARDLARFGLLFLDKGKWSGAQIVPSHWVMESTRAHSETDRPGRGYGYLWWTLDAAEWGEGAALAAGYGGQLVVIVPQKRLVAVELVELDRNVAGIRTADFLTLVRGIVDLLR